MKQRFVFIDLLRFVAALFMIQGHIFDALLHPEVKAHPSFYIYDFFHGFTAPAFLFASGVAYGISTMKGWEEHIVWGPKVRARATRFLGLIAIGYALHLPYFSLRKTLNQASATEIRAFLQSDVLQCIGVTLLLLQGGILLIKNRKVFEWVVAGAAAIVILSAPLMWSARLAGVLPVAVVSYLTPETGSWFPLFPWAAYILCGAAFGFSLARVQDRSHAASVMLKVGVLSIVTLALAWAAMYLPFDFYGTHDFWKSNPAMFLVRLSLVSVVASCIFLAEYWSGAHPEVPSILGRESLFIYILHLVIVYGSVLNRGLAQRSGSLWIAGSLAVFVAVLAGITIVTLLWHHFKTKHQGAAWWVIRGGAAAFLIAFLVRPW